MKFKLGDPVYPTISQIFCFTLWNRKALIHISLIFRFKLPIIPYLNNLLFNFFKLSLNIRIGNAFFKNTILLLVGYIYQVPLCILSFKRLFIKVLVHLFNRRFFIFLGLIFYFHLFSEGYHFIYTLFCCEPSFLLAFLVRMPIAYVIFALFLLTDFRVKYSFLSIYGRKPVN